MRLAARLLAWAAGRWGVDAGTLDRLAAARALGRPTTPRLPWELVPLGARFLARGLHTLLAIPARRDWVWPFWLERQLDPQDAAYTGRGHLPVLLNMTHRNWTAVGPPARPGKAVVDPRGLVTPRHDGWSWDLGLCLAGRHVFPSRHDRVEQRPAASHHAVVTRLEAQGVVLEHEVYAVDGWLHQEVRLEGPLQGVELELHLRPANPEGLSPVRRVALEGRVLRVNGRPGLYLAPPPDAWRASDEVRGDAAQGAGGPAEARSEAGLATASTVWRGVRELHVAAPLGEAAGAAPPGPPGEPSGEARRRSEALWALAGRAATIATPEPRLDRAFALATRHLLALHDGETITPGAFTYRLFWFRDAAYQVSALDRLGLHEAAGRVLEGYPARQRSDGYFVSQDGEWDSGGQAIFALTEHARLSRDRAFLERHASSIARGAAWIARTRARTSALGPALAGLMPAGFSAEHLGPPDHYYWDAFWSLAGLRRAAEAARELGRAAEAAGWEREAAALGADLARSLAGVERRLGSPFIPASPSRGRDTAAIGALAALYPVALVPASDPALRATVEWLTAVASSRGAFYHEVVHSGYNPYLSLQLAMAWLELGDPAAAWRIADAVLGMASPTGCWPEAVHPRTGGGVMGDGHHGWAAAEVIHLARRLFFREEAEGLVLLDALPPGWPGPGERLEAHGLASRHGPVHLEVEAGESVWRVRLEGPSAPARLRDREIPPGVPVEVRRR